MMMAMFVAVAKVHLCMCVYTIKKNSNDNL